MLYRLHQNSAKTKFAGLVRHEHVMTHSSLRRRICVGPSSSIWMERPCAPGATPLLFQSSASEKHGDSEVILRDSARKPCFEASGSGCGTCYHTQRSARIPSAAHILLPFSLSTRRPISASTAFPRPCVPLPNLLITTPTPLYPPPSPLPQHTRAPAPGASRRPGRRPSSPARSATARRASRCHARPPSGPFYLSHASGQKG